MPELPQLQDTPQFNLQPELTGKKLMLRPLQLADYEALYSVASDPLIWEQHPSPNRHTREEFNLFFNESLASGGALLVIDINSKAPIGATRFYHYDRENSCIEIGWTFLSRAYWGGDYNSELKNLMFMHSGKFVNSVILYVDPTNKRSQKAVTKIGGIKDSKLDNKGRLVYRVSVSKPISIPGSQ